MGGATGVGLASRIRCRWRGALLSTLRRTGLWSGRFAGFARCFGWIGLYEFEHSMTTNDEDNEDDDDMKST